MISPDRLERYKDFIDPERTGAPYDSRQGVDRLMGVLSPDPKGVVLASMGQDWYGGERQLRSAVFQWLGELGLPSGLWPITASANWSYCVYRKEGEILDGSLVELGAVVKKAEDASQTLYSRSVAGAELAVPLVQQAIRFVSKAREYAEAKVSQGEIPHKFDSMWRIISAVSSPTDQRRPGAIWDVVDFLAHNPGKYREVDLVNSMHISQYRLKPILFTLGDCGIINYHSPMKDEEGHTGRGWSVYTLVDPKLMAGLEADEVLSNIKSIRNGFSHYTAMTKTLNYIRKHPKREYEYRALAKELGIYKTNISMCLGLLAELGLLERPDPGYKGGNTASLVETNDLTHLFYDLVCEPAREVADTLSPLPIRLWDRRELAMYLENYNEERSHKGTQGTAEVKRILVDALPKDGSERKISHIVALYNEQSDRRLGVPALTYHLRRLLRSGQIEQPRPRYYRRVQKEN